MRGALKIGRFWGIPVFLHWSFALIFGLAAYQGFTSDSSNPVRTTFWLIGLFLAVFVCVLLHEYGHALAARRYGVGTRDIILTPIGGIARLETMPRKPSEEFVVAIAGPLVNVLIAALLFFPVSKMVGAAGLELVEAIWQALKLAFLGIEPDTRPNIDDAQMHALEVGENWVGFLVSLLFINCSLVVFNLVPAFPMDGGRILRSLLAMRFGFFRATKWAAFLGQIFAVGFVVLAFQKGSPMMGLIGVFVFTTARAEWRTVQLEALLGRFTVADVFRENFTKIQTNDWMQTPISTSMQGTERHFLVFDLEDDLVATLPDFRIVEAMKGGKSSASVAEFMQNDFETVEKTDSLRKVFAFLRQAGYPILAVVENESVIGCIDSQQLDNFLRLQNSLASPSPFFQKNKG